jgi:hypothetical protein
MTKLQAINAAKNEANALIDQLERIAKGWDKGRYRDDDTLRMFTVQQGIQTHVQECFRLAIEFKA